jgi:hypothetical protein
MTQASRTDPTTAAGRDFLDWWQGREYVTVTLDFAEVSVALIEAEARTSARRVARAAVERAIFDLPIGDDVTYSRGYSAGTTAARESLRAALDALESKP